jgi:Peptidase family S41
MIMNAGPRSAEIVRRARRGVLLSEALAEAGTGRRVDLDGGQRLQVLDTLIASLGGAYAHLPAKRAAYATDPVQALTLLRRRAADLSDTEFNRAVSAIITRLRDAHTRYIGPSTLRDQVAVLPFLVEQYGPESRPRYLVSKINTDAIDDPEFQPGIELEAWNGAPFARAVENHADVETGGRSDSRRARALESLTFRALDYGPPPDEHWVIVGYRTKRGRKAEIRLPWRLLTPGKAATALEPGSRAALKQASDPSAEAVRRAKKLVFAPNLWASDHDRRPAPAAPGKAEIGEWLETPMQDVLAARSLSRKVGYLRIWSFDLDDDDAFIEELIRLLGLLPPTGLIVDLRANPGGLIWAAERALQLFTDAPIQPTRFSLIATPLTRQMADNPFNRLELEAWSPSLQDAVSTGELYAQPLPLTDPSWCNDKGRKYPGPSVAVVDANTYSSGDLFAAGWVDHGIGPLVSVGQATGAGGANVWTSSQLRDALSGTDHQQPRMPAGTGFTLAFRRAIRSGAGDGIPIEDLGIPGIPYEMSKNDLMRNNKDLLGICTRLLNDVRQSGDDHG